MPHGRLDDMLNRKEVSTMKRILIATDGSPGGAEAVEQGLALAAAVRARVTFVYVRKRAHEIVGDAYYQRALTAAFARGRQVIQEALAAAETWNVDAEG